MEDIKYNIIKTRESPMLLVFRIFWLNIFFNFIYMAISLIADNSEIFNNEGSIFAYDSLTLIILILLQIIIIGFLILQWFKEYYVLEEGYVSHKKGVFTKREQKYSTNNIRSIHIKKSFRGNMMEYGNIIISYPQGAQTAIFNNISNPEQIIYFIEKAGKSA